MDTFELISLIIPVYNTKKYLDECLQSVFAQTYTNLEIIIVDDGSTDGTGEMCDRYPDVDARVKVFHKTNEGLGLTRNYGMQYATGKYICFLDSDDKIQPGFIEELYRGLTENHVDLCKAGYTRFKGTEALNKKQYTNTVYTGDQAKTQFLPRLVGASPEGHDSVEMSVWAVLYRFDIIKEHNLKFPSERELISEDIVFNIQYFQYANGGCLIESTGYYYRVNDTSLTRSYRADRFEAYKRFYQFTKNLLTELGYKEDTIFRLDRYFFICLRKAIHQEGDNPNPDSISDNLRIICTDTLVQDIIASYPCNKLGFKQSLFLRLIKAKKVSLLRLLLRSKLL